MILGWGGLPVIWSGDELATPNDPDWAQEPGHESDNRWAHRPALDPARVAQIQGDLSVFSGGRIAAFRTGATFGTGDLPWWLAPQAWVEGRFERIAGLFLLAAVLLGVPWYWALRRKAAIRLRARTQPGRNSCSSALRVATVAVQA